MANVTRKTSIPSLSNQMIMIDIDNDELIGKYITIKRNGNAERETILVKVMDGDSYTLGELVITDNMKVFYNHKKRVEK